ncbi:helix-turn-helix domain-containing protein [Chryseobacterium gregarium]|uniref:helix-turn-helix domain-containing protein n=1 Tax=Chryseobacterium gregarium TaxID=456299 RepID=UPI00040E2584|nr:AraC family transcriptional regulator [Chryseobacterium gregarium]
MDTFTTYSYVSDRQVPRNKILLPNNMVSLLEQGEKIVYYANHKTIITDNQFAILSSGNCLMTEKIPVNNTYRSTMLFFDNSAWSKFFVKYASVIDRIPPNPGRFKKPFAVFEKDEFIKAYLTSLKLIQLKPASFSDKMTALKFEELMLHLLENYPEEILSFHAKNQEEYSDFEIRKAVELNITNNLTLEELAFLCHTSASTFKRKFIKLYHQAPGQYFLHQKMETARSLLLQNENPGIVAYKVGYENHSSFSQVFKKVYGMSPKEFKQQNLTVSGQHLTDHQ